MLRYTRGSLHFDVSVNKCYYYYYPTRGSSHFGRRAGRRGAGATSARPRLALALFALNRLPSALSSRSTARASTTLASSLRVSCKFPVVSVTFHHHPLLRNLLNLHPLLVLPVTKETMLLIKFGYLLIN